MLTATYKGFNHCIYELSQNWWIGIFRLRHPYRLCIFLLQLVALLRMLMTWRAKNPGTIDVGTISVPTLYFVGVNILSHVHVS